MPNKILFLVEGKKPEDSILRSLAQFVLPEVMKDYIVTIYGNNIYELFAELELDSDLDLVELIRERYEPIELKGIRNREIGEVYLFFDYDGHSHHANDDDLHHMISKFQDETDQGKLFISYPMSEAIRDFCDHQKYCRNCEISISDFSQYKMKSAQNSNYNQVDSYSNDVWNDFIKYSVSKVKCLKNGNVCSGVAVDIPTYDEAKTYDQLCILDLQKPKIDNASSVYVLSSYPFFALNYFREERYNSTVNRIM